MNVLQQLQAGIRVEFNESGRFLRILASEVQDKITVQFYRNGAMICEALQVGRGFSETMEDGNFDSYAVTSSVTQNVNIVTRAGSKIVYDTPPVGDVNILSLPPVTIANPDAQKQYFTYGASFKSNAALAANTAEQVFSAAANVNGVVVHSAGLQAAAVDNTWKNSTLLAKATAPANTADGDVILNSSMAISNSGVINCAVSAQLQNAVLIPAGKGLYFISNSADGGSTAIRHVLYTIL